MKVPQKSILGTATQVNGYMASEIGPFEQIFA